MSSKNTEHQNGFAKKKYKTHEGIAVFQLIGYFKNAKDADKFMNKKFLKSKDKYRIYRKEVMKLWGTEYEKP